ncbi:hypothetical protein CC86DRAFT_381843 [Ophiobolus disseminans]|uniref:Uncharacterized protein n=1 Tax=Ophiobolus disseminans TaxID=1469910 RepID=A0A6A7A1J4_9PLEO|nr:hypothetical protein CC86DRAFT_381843 [Ophiobolus disseminans]
MTSERDGEYMPCAFVLLLVELAKNTRFSHTLPYLNTLRKTLHSRLPSPSAQQTGVSTFLASHNNDTNAAHTRILSTMHHHKDTALASLLHDMRVFFSSLTNPSRMGGKEIEGLRDGARRVEMCVKGLREWVRMIRDVDVQEKRK